MEKFQRQQHQVKTNGASRSEITKWKTVTVKVPVIVTPKVTPIEVEVGTPITKDDVKKHIELPKEEGWEIIEENWVIPTTETPGVKNCG